MKLRTILASFALAALSLPVFAQNTLEQHQDAIRQNKQAVEDATRQHKDQVAVSNAQIDAAATTNSPSATVPTAPSRWIVIQ